MLHSDLLEDGLADKRIYQEEDQETHLDAAVGDALDVFAQLIDYTHTDEHDRRAATITSERDSGLLTGETQE